MKKLFCVILSLAMLLTLAACGPQEKPNDTTPPKTTGTQTEPPKTEPPKTEPPETEPPETNPPEADITAGVFADGVYTNEFLGLQCALEDNWYVFSSSELAQLVGVIADNVTDEDWAEILRNSGTAYVLYAQNLTDGSTINIVLEKLNAIQGILITPEQYAQASVDQLPAALEASGATNVTAQAGSASFAGEPHTSIAVRCDIGGIALYETMIVRKAGSYMACITVGAQNEERVEELLALFSSI